MHSARNSENWAGFIATLLALVASSSPAWAATLNVNAAARIRLLYFMLSPQQAGWIWARRHVVPARSSKGPDAPQVKRKK
jgi:hypothetical protein